MNVSVLSHGKSMNSELFINNIINILILTTKKMFIIAMVVNFHTLVMGIQEALQSDTRGTLQIESSTLIGRMVLISHLVYIILCNTSCLD